MSFSYNYISLKKCLVKVLICTSFSDKKVMDCVNNELISNFMGLFCTKK